MDSVEKVVLHSTGETYSIKDEKCSSLDVQISRDGLFIRVNGITDIKYNGVYSVFYKKRKAKDALV